VFSTDDPNSAFDTKVLDSRTSVSEDGRVAIGEPPSPDFTPVPSTLRLLGRQFNDPAVAAVVESYPLPVVEDPSSHTCVVQIGSGPNTTSVTPEGLVFECFEGWSMFLFLQKQIRNSFVLRQKEIWKSFLLCQKQIWKSFLPR
jgi:hypothetical protein